MRQMPFVAEQVEDFCSVHESPSGLIRIRGSGIDGWCRNLKIIEHTKFCIMCSNLVLSVLKLGK